MEQQKLKKELEAQRKKEQDAQEDERLQKERDAIWNRQKQEFIKDHGNI